MSTAPGPFFMPKAIAGEGVVTVLTVLLIVLVVVAIVVLVRR